MSKYKYVLDDGKDEYGIKELQDKLLEIAVYLDGFCREYGITYFLMGGSALGAVRHKGFIPWDDDMDIFMDYENYDRFLNLCDKYLDKEKYYLQKGMTEELPYYYSKLRMNGTTYIEDVNLGRAQMHQGIYIDVMCLHNAAPKGYKRKLQYYLAAMLKGKAVSETNYHPEGFKKKAELALIKLFIGDSVKNLIFNQATKYDGIKTAEFAHVFNRAKFDGSFYPADDFREQRYVPFESVMLPIPNGAEDYLAIRYGDDFMEMPSEETKSKYKNHAAYWSITEDYRKMRMELPDKR